MTRESSLALRNRLHNVVRQHEKWRRRDCINLIPSENITSPAVRWLLASDLAHRYTARDSFYMGAKYLDDVEAECVEIAKKVFRCKYAEVRALSGHHCNMILMMSLLKSGDATLCVSPENGGYPGISSEGLARILGLRSLYFPFDDDRMNIDVEAAKGLIQHEKPRCTTFGASFFLFPHPLRELSNLDGNPLRIYDGSHVLGLIAGRAFQDPLREGSDVLIGSTHKSFFGPQGGIICTNNDGVWEAISKNIHPGLVDNAHWNRIAALAHSLLEALRFGSQYARQVIRNSKALAKALAEQDIPVRCKDYGFTESHQVVLHIENSKERARVARVLESANIIVDSGIRIGTSEVTRLGMKEKEMERVANLIADAVEEKRDATKISRDVKRLSSEFREIRFALT